MLKNHNHDLIQQLSEISDSAWRIEEYLKSAKRCGSCQKLWKKLLADYETHIAMLRDEIKKHVFENRFE